MTNLELRVHLRARLSLLVHLPLQLSHLLPQRLHPGVRRLRLGVQCKAEKQV